MASGTSFVIDVGMKMTGVAAGTAQLATLADQLSGAGAASDAAAKALGEGEKRYAALEKNAIRAATALERAGMKSTGSVPADLKAKADAAAGALRGEAMALDQLRAKATAAAGAHSKLAADMKSAEAAAKAEAKAAEAANAAAQGSGKVNEMAEALGKLGGPMGMAGSRALGLVEGVQKLGGSLGTGAGAAAAAAGATVALAAAVIAAAAAFAVGVVRVAAWAVGLSDARRNAALAVEAVSQTHASLKNLAQVLPAVASGVTLAQGDLVDLAKALAGANVSAADMPAALRAVALAEDALGKGGAAKFIEELKSGKKTVGELAKEMESKFGGTVAKKMLGLDAQAERLKTNFGEIFSLDVDPLLQGLSTLVALFDKNTAMGKTLQFIFRGLFQPVIDAATAAIPVVEAFLLGVAIGALKIYIAFKPAIKAVRELFGETDTSGLPSALEVALFLGKALAAAIGTVVVGVGIFAAALAAPIAGFMRLYAAGYTAWETLKAGAAMAVGYLESISLADIGTNMIQGLADGLTGGASKVIDAITGVVKGAITTAKGLLQQHSPSKVFLGIGENTALGFEQGIAQGADGAQSALERMVAPPPVQSGRPSVGGQPLTVNLTINAPTGDAGDIASEVSKALTRIFEGDLLQSGGGGAP
jgi:hypothetical protein